MSGTTEDVFLNGSKLDSLSMDMRVFFTNLTLFLICIFSLMQIFALLPMPFSLIFIIGSVLLVLVHIWANQKQLKEFSERLT